MNRKIFLGAMTLMTIMSTTAVVSCGTTEMWHLYYLTSTGTVKLDVDFTDKTNTLLAPTISSIHTPLLNKIGETLIEKRFEGVSVIDAEITLGNKTEVSLHYKKTQLDDYYIVEGEKMTFRSLVQLVKYNFENNIFSTSMEQIKRNLGGIADLTYQGYLTYLIAAGTIGNDIPGVSLGVEISEGNS